MQEVSKDTSMRLEQEESKGSESSPVSRLVRFMLRPFWRRVQRHLRVQVRAYHPVVIPQLLPFSRAASYSCVQLEREVELDPGHQYIFGWHPHGILLLSHCAVCGGLWEKLFPGIEQRVRH
jgi:hypothetical protein